MTRYAVAAALAVLGTAAMNAQASAQPALAPAAMEQDASGGKCYDCPPAKKYDSEEVIKTTKDVDHSRVINTTTEVPVGRRVKETYRPIVRQKRNARESA